MRLGIEALGGTGLKGSIILLESIHKATVFDQTIKQAADSLAI